MKIKLNLGILLLGSILYSEVAISAIACNNMQNSTEVYYVNGIRNTEDDANDSLKLIKQAYEVKLKATYPYDDIKYKLAYNETYKDYGNIGDWFNDDKELHRLKQQENSIYFPNVSFWNYPKLVRKWKEREEAFKNKSRCTACDATEYWYYHKQYHDITLNLEEIENRCKPPKPAPDPNKTIRDTFSKHLTLYQNALNHGKRIILIAHSQGNLFANMAIRQLRPKYTKNVGMIGLGSVAGYWHSGTFYYTAYLDYAVNGFRATFYKILPGNINNRSTRHSFNYGYFSKEKPSRAKVDEKIHYYLKTLEQPKPIFQLGALMVTLTWEGNTDVDLHIREPNGTKVLYSNKTGNFGTIDVDNTRGKGPEHYVVPCSSQIEGEYEIGVNYFSGTGVENVKVQITSENGDSKIFAKKLETANGVNGNTAPVKVAKVKVYKDSNGKYIYQITNLGE